VPAGPRTGADFGFILAETMSVPEIPSSGISALPRQRYQQLLIHPLGIPRQRQ
jgi:hypothetical protein